MSVPMNGTRREKLETICIRRRHRNLIQKTSHQLFQMLALRRFNYCTAPINPDSSNCPVRLDGIQYLAISPFITCDGSLLSLLRLLVGQLSIVTYIISDMASRLQQISRHIQSQKPESMIEGMLAKTSDCLTMLMVHRNVE
jgi:hypothetical protein